MEEYSWLQEYKRTWEQLQEDILPSPQKHVVRSHHVRPLLRNFFLVLDCSKSAAKNDFKPSRMQLVGKVAQTFTAQFKANNPLSLITTIVASDGLARLVTSLQDLRPSGEFSLQNSLELVLKQVPTAQLHYSTEVLIVQNSLWSCDPGDIWETLGKVKENCMQVSVISLVPEVYLMRKTAEMTGGSIEVALHEEDLAEIWKIRASAGDPALCSALVPLGFPTHTSEISPCACHFTLGPGYFCPICKAKTCSLPCKCSICGFFLISNPHLVQASLSLQPIQDFAAAGEGLCAGCEVPGVLRVCPTCSAAFCSRCEDFIRSTLGHCVNCPV